jgi:hypothetical protein
MITIKSLPFVTAQEVFDQVVRTSLIQGKKSYDNKTDKCLYRGPNGTKCNAGQLIGDDEYQELWDINSYAWNTLVSKGAVPESHRSLITSLQRAHDNHAPDSWPYIYESVAEEHGLKYDHDEA